MSPPRETRTRSLPTDGELASRARAIFGEACTHTDPHYALRLRLARRHALDVTERAPRRAWIPLAGAAAACCALVAGIILALPGQHVASTQRATSSATATSDELVDVGSPQMDMVQDLEFYRWLATQPAMASAAGRGSH